MSLDEDDSTLFIVLPIGKHGSACTLDTSFTTVGKAGTGRTLLVCAPVKTGCISTGSCFWTDVLLSPKCNRAVDEELEMAPNLMVGCWDGNCGVIVVAERSCFE